MRMETSSKRVLIMLKSDFDLINLDKEVIYDSDCPRLGPSGVASSIFEEIKQFSGD